MASLKKVLNPTPLPDGRWLAIRYGEEETPMRELSVVLGFDEEIRRKTD